ncbi:hypothetical protein ACOCJ4_16650 [Knoellia sp. CPCC 206435]|uniref:hypothetical protein n=1 Tax=Knoellia terrae TaxID=3404797 RepID=UPI003B43A0B2
MFSAQPQELGKTKPDEGLSHWLSKNNQQLLILHCQPKENSSGNDSPPAKGQHATTSETRLIGIDF